MKKERTQFLLVAAANHYYRKFIFVNVAASLHCT